LPPLRVRIEDIPVLVEEIISRLAKEMQLTSLPAIDHASVMAPSGYDWPGNVTAVRNVLERSLMVSDDQILNVALLAIHATHQSWSHASSFPPHERMLHNVTEELIESLILEALRHCEGNRRSTASVLGIARDSLYRRMKPFGIKTESQSMNAPD
jgi:DNA-binding NtrC family response regulator